MRHKSIRVTVFVGVVLSVVAALALAAAGQVHRESAGRARVL